MICPKCGKKNIEGLYGGPIDCSCEECIMKELLFSIDKKDFDITYFSGTGAGGQYRNKHQNCVRIKHRDSGVLSTGQSHRDRKANTKEALNGLISNPKFKIWLNTRVYEISEGKKIEEKVDEMMSLENIKIEGKNEDGRWEDI